MGRVYPYEKIWWLNPIIVFGLLMGVIIAGTSAVSEQNYLTFYNVNKFIDGINIYFAVFASLAFMFGCFMSRVLFKDLRRTEVLFEDFQRHSSLCTKIVYLLFTFTMFGYFMSFLSLMNNGANILIFYEVIKGEAGAIYQLKHNMLTKTAGVTSFTNFGIPFIILAAYYMYFNRNRIIKVMIITIILLTIFRALFFAERLALLEITIPYLIVYVILRVTKKGELRNINLIPVILVPLIVVLFGIGEYFRSWTNYYQYVYPSYFDFLFIRLSGYYVTALNTGFMYLTQFNFGYMPFPYFTLEWLWKFPLMPGGVYESTWNVSPTFLFQNELETTGNPEFNNPSGLLLPFHDFGFLGGIVFWVFMGVITGGLYALFVKGYPFGMLLYPIWFLGITEVPRYFYFGSGRFFPAWVFIVIVTLIFSFNRKVIANPIFKKSMLKEEQLIT
jgi:oligosaccharide repeat unit polymerase